MQEGAYGHPWTPEEFRECVVDMVVGYKKSDPWIFPPVVDTWVTKIAGYERNNLSTKLENDIISLTFALTDTVCGMYITMHGKKYKEMIKFYKEQDALFMAEHGKSIEYSAEYSYRVIMACIEYMGYKREPSVGDQCVDVSKVPFWGFVELE